jgi:hypothetical protein
VLRDDYTCHSTTVLRKPNDDWSHQNNRQSNGWAISVLVFSRVHWALTSSTRVIYKGLYTNKVLREYEMLILSLYRKCNEMPHTKIIY